MTPTRNYRLYLIALSASFSWFIAGIGLGWTSPILPKFIHNTTDSPLGAPITLAEQGWIVGVTQLSAMPGALINVPLANLIGRKWTLLLSGLLTACACIIFLISHEVWHIIVARAIVGVAGSCALSSAPLYVAEIAAKECRGVVCSFNTLCMIFGIVFAFALGPYVDYMTYQALFLAVTVLFIVLFSFMPETPYLHALKGRTKEGVRSLKFIRGLNTRDAEDEMVRLQKDIVNATTENSSFVEMILNKANRKALVLCCSLMALEQMNGVGVVTLYTETILSDANLHINPSTAAIILPFSEIFPNIITIFTIEKYGRKTLLIFSASGMCVAMTLLGTYLYFQAQGITSSLSWMPICLLVIYKMFQALGFGTVPWTLLGEMFSAKFRYYGPPISVFVFFLFSFILSRFFPEVNALGTHYAFWGFGGSCLISVLFVKFLLIETKGLSFEKIQTMLS